MLALLLLLAVASPGPLGSLPQPLPTLDRISLAKARSGIPVVEAEQDQSGQGGRSTGHLLMRAPPAVVWEVLTDHSRFPEFMPHLVAAQVTNRTATGERCLQTVDAVVQKVSYTLDFRWDPATMHIDYKLADGVPGDLKSVLGHWQLWSEAKGRATLVEYVNQVDVGTYVPGFIRGYLADSALRDSLDAVRKRVEERASK